MRTFFKFVLFAVLSFSLISCSGIKEKISALFHGDDAVTKVAIETENRDLYCFKNDGRFAVDNKLKIDFKSYEEKTKRNADFVANYVFQGYCQDFLVYFRYDYFVHGDGSDDWLVLSDTDGTMIPIIYFGCGSDLPEVQIKVSGQNILIASGNEYDGYPETYYSYDVVSGKLTFSSKRDFGVLSSGNDYPGDYPEASTRRLTEEDLYGMSKAELRIMRNEIYARHGYIFKSEDLKRHFSRFSWYYPVSSDVSSQLSKTEQQNVVFIQAHE